LARQSAELKDAMSFWEMMDVEYYPGLGRIFVEFQGALSQAEGNARRRYDIWRRAHPEG